MNWLALPFILTALSYLVLGSWVIARHTSHLQRLYGLFSIGTSLWQWLWAVLLTSPHVQGLYGTTQACYSGIVMIPAIFYHFISTFTEQQNHKWWFRAVYGISFFLLLSIWVDHLFLRGFNQYHWGL